MTTAPVALRARSRRRIRDLIDVPSRLNASAMLVLVPAVALLIVGLTMILSASSVAAYERYGSSFLFFFRQLMWAAVGIVALVAFASIDYRRWRGWGYLLLIASLVGLVAVLHPALGIRVGGSSRWIGAGPLRMQPSELAKLGLALVAADICTRKAHRLRTVGDLMRPLGVLVGLIGVLVVAQPDLGTTIIIAMIAFAVVLVAGAPVPQLGMIGLGGVGLVAALSMTEGYRRARLLSFFNPFRDPLNGGYQAVQSMIALGSGGLFGVGLGASRQKWLYVPNAHTDFIFAILGEETGLVGTFFVIGLFMCLAYAGIRVARRAPDPFGRLVAAAVTVWVVGQAVLNMGAVTGLLPITGVPLPLVSFGGSSLVFTLAGVGLLVNIARHETWPVAPQTAASPPPMPARSQAGSRAASGRRIRIGHRSARRG